MHNLGAAKIHGGREFKDVLEKAKSILKPDGAIYLGETWGAGSPEIEDTEKTARTVGLQCEHLVEFDYRDSEQQPEEKHARIIERHMGLGEAEKIRKWITAYPKRPEYYYYLLRLTKKA